MFILKITLQLVHIEYQYMDVKRKSYTQVSSLVHRTKSFMQNITFRVEVSPGAVRVGIRTHVPQHGSCQ